MTGDYQLTLAQPDHFDKLYDLMVAFIKEDTPYRVVPIDRETITNTIRAFFDHSDKQIAIVLLHKGKPVGVAVGKVEPCPFAKVKSAVEIVWKVDKEHRNSKGGLELFKAYEHWVENVALADMSVLSSVRNKDSDRICKVYQRKGYDEAERTFVKFYK